MSSHKLRVWSGLLNWYATGYYYGPDPPNWPDEFTMLGMKFIFTERTYKDWLGDKELSISYIGGPL